MKFGRNWSIGSENVKSVQMDGQRDRQTNRGMTGDQNSSLELAAQVS